jgi:hypothetical protein
MCNQCDWEAKIIKVMESEKDICIDCDNTRCEVCKNKITKENK